MRGKLPVAERLGAIGQAAVEVARAEYGALAAELRLTGKRFLGVLLLAATALFMLFWSFALLAFAAVEGLALVLPRWGAALAVFGVFLLVIAVLALIAWKRLERLSPPQAIVRRRFDEHVDWLRRRVTRGQPGLSSEPDPGPGGERERW